MDGWMDAVGSKTKMDPASCLGPGGRVALEGCFYGLLVASRQSGCSQQGRLEKV